MICDIAGCSSKVLARGLCSKHYNRTIRHGSPHTVKRHQLTRGAGWETMPEYQSWSSMRLRCMAKTGRHYKYYGSRGIKICEHWLHSFENFYKDMGPKPSPEHTLDRVDNDGNYEPLNCRWATPSQQNFNRRRPLVYNSNC